MDKLNENEIELALDELEEGKFVTYSIKFPKSMFSNTLGEGLLEREILKKGLDGVFESFINQFRALNKND